MYHIGGGFCSLCKSPRTNKSTCPLNPLAKTHDSAKHPLAEVEAVEPKPEPVAAKPKPKPAAAKPKPKPAAAKPKPVAAKPVPVVEPALVDAPKGDPHPDFTGLHQYLEVIKYLEGPVSVEFMVPTEELRELLGHKGPDLLLMGDFHYGNARCPTCKPTEGCYSFYNDDMIEYLDFVANKFNITTDIFLEFWFRKDQSLSYYVKPDSALVNVIKATEPCRPEGAKYKKCILKKIRAHMTDIRVDRSSKYKGDSIYQLYQDVRKTYNGEQKFKHICETDFPDIPYNDIKTMVNKFFDPLTSAEEIHTDYLTAPFFKKYSRLHHELAQLSEPIRNNIIKHLVIPHSPEDKKYRLAMITNANHAQWYLTPVDSARMLDAYTICRLFKNYTDGKYTEFGIVYLGADHVMHIARVLKLLGYYTTKWAHGIHFEGTSREYILSLFATHGDEEAVTSYFNTLKCMKMG
jgi:hypothetical protein